MQCLREDNIDSALHAELKAILFGLEVSRNNFSEPIIVESDSLLSITEISMKNNSFCEWDGIISDSLDLSLVVVVVVVLLILGDLSMF